MNWLYLYRNFTLGLCLLLSVPTLGLIAHWTQRTTSVGLSLDWEGLGLYICCLSWIAFPAMLAIPEFRRNAYVTYILSEILIILCIWGQWLALVILIFQHKEQFFPRNSCDFVSADLVIWCDEFFAIQDIAITILALLALYMLSLMFYALVSQTLGNPVWLRSVQEVQNKTSSHSDTGINETIANSPISTSPTGHSVVTVVTPPMTQQVPSTSSRGTRSVALNQRPTLIIQTPGISVDETIPAELVA